MAKEMTPIDISTNLDLVRLAEEVARSGEPRVLRRADEDVAVLMPIKKPASHQRTTRKKTEEDHEAFLASAGSWEDMDTDKLIEDIYESRDISTRPPVDL